MAHRLSRGIPENIFRMMITNGHLTHGERKIIELTEQYHSRMRMLKTRVPERPIAANEATVAHFINRPHREFERYLSDEEEKIWKLRRAALKWISDYHTEYRAHARFTVGVNGEAADREAHRDNKKNGQAKALERYLEFGDDKYTLIAKLIIDEDVDAVYAALQV